MYTLVYNALRKRLLEITALREVQLAGNQYEPDKRQPVITTPVVYIQFESLDTMVMGGKIQYAEADIAVQLITSNTFGTGRRVRKAQPNDHMSIFDSIYASLQGFRARASYLDADVEADFVIMHSMARVATTPPQILRKMQQSTQIYRCLIYDQSANPSLQKIVADLDITPEFD